MTTKELGYVELEWTCPRCGTRNPGTQTTCSNCGAPQPKDVKFETPAQAELIQDKEKIARAESGPDIVCGYCGTRNPAGAKVCKQCGADLTAGTARGAGDVVGAFQNQPVPEVKCPTCGAKNPATAQNCENCGAPLARAPVTAPVQTPPPATRGFGWLPLVVIGLVVVAIVYFGVLSMRTTAVVGTVREARWTTSIPVEGLAPVRYSDWEELIPAGADVESCRQEVRYEQDSPGPNTREVCGTPYTVDTGTGLGRVVQDCHYQVLEDMCSYTVNEWRVVNVLKQSGNGFSPEWPLTTLGPRQRLGSRSVNYECVVAANDQWYTYSPSSLDEYLTCKPGEKFNLQINGFGQINSIQPLQ